MPDLRKVTGKLLHPSGEPRKNAVLRFKLKEYGVDGEIIYPRKTIETNTDDQGDFNIDLWVNDASETPAAYQCELPSNEVFEFILPPGENPISLSELHNLHAPEGSGQFQTIIEFLESHTTSLQDQLEDHIAQTEDVHGAEGEVVGTQNEQTLTNKTLPGGRYNH